MLGSAAQQIIVQMSVSLRRGRLGVAKQFANDRQTETTAGAERCIGVTEILRSRTTLL
jgi:hypothetical protein